ncbi:hypothetical protein CPB85DRAFT_1342819 [Mucidula mucida]|nr:hypothetical protein CPB85DRAFT_1342819 [Mucidula mucida]
MDALVPPPSPAPHPNALIDLLGQLCGATTTHPGVIYDSAPSTVSPVEISRLPDTISSYVPPDFTFLPKPPSTTIDEPSSRPCLAASDPDTSAPTPSSYEESKPSKSKDQSPPFRCPDCTKKYARKSRLYEHRRRRHNYRPVCEYCQKKFKFVRELKTHVKSEHLVEHCAMLVDKPGPSM